MNKYILLFCHRCARRSHDVGELRGGGLSVARASTSQNLYLFMQEVG